MSDNMFTAVLTFRVDFKIDHDECKSVNMDPEKVRDELVAQFVNLPDRISGDGMLTYDLPAVVDSWSATYDERDYHQSVALFEEARIAEASANNLTEEDSDILTSGWDKSDARFAPLVVYQKPDYGWFVLCDGMHKEAKAFRKAVENLELSDAFCQLVLEASKQGFRWLDIDRDADPVHGLPEFDW